MTGGIVDMITLVMGHTGSIGSHRRVGIITRTVTFIVGARITVVPRRCPERHVLIANAGNGMIAVRIYRGEEGLEWYDRICVVTANLKPTQPVRIPVVSAGMGTEQPRR
jgi:hypothetical protein